MDRDAAVALIARRLGNRTDLNSDIVTELGYSQTILEQDAAITPWFLTSERSTASTTADEERIELPSDFLREYEYGTLWVYDSTEDDPWIELAKDDYDDLVSYHKGATGQPVSYALVGKYFRLFPTPDDAYTLKMIYIKQDDALSAGSTENEWLKYAPYLLCGHTGMAMAAYLQNKIAYAMFEKMEADARKRLLVENASREVANMELSMGGE